MTDDLGQDLLARLLYGGRISLAVGVAAMLIAITLGTLVGAAAGQAGGVTDHVLMRLTDLFLSLPQLPLPLLVVYLFRDPLKRWLGPEAGVFVLIVAVIGGLRWMPVDRLVRAQFLSLREQEFVQAARGLGAGTLRQTVRHILPNPVIVAGSLDVAAAILAESSLSFLGLGFPPDIPTWGGSSSTPGTTWTSPRTGRCFPARLSLSPCPPSTTWATGCGTRSIPGASSASPRPPGGHEGSRRPTAGGVRRGPTHPGRRSLA